MKTLRICAALIALACSAISAHAATRVYELGGLGCPFLNPTASLALKIRGAVVQTGCYFNAGAFEADALSHRGDRVIVVAHSMGDVTGAAMTCDLVRRGMNVEMIALDALLTGASTRCGHTVHFWQGGYPMPGARNIYVASAYGHVGFPSDPNVQARVLAAAGAGGIAHSHHRVAARHVTRHHHQKAVRK